MAGDTGKQALYEQFAQIGKTLTTPIRLLLLDLLGQAERSVDELAVAAEATVANTSSHLQALRRTGLVTTRREGTRIYYRLAGNDVLTLVTTLTRVATEHSAAAAHAAQDYLGDLQALEPVTAEQLHQRMSTGEVAVLDVRPVLEYAAGHIPTARCIPVEELRARLHELPADTEVIAYCRGPYCVYAPQAVRLLQEHGVWARPLTDGLPGWNLAGLPIESTPMPA